MSEPFVGEIKMFGFPFAPRGYALCQGQTMQITQNQALYALIGTIYGGDARTTFMLPDLRCKMPICVGSGAKIGSVNLTPRNIGAVGGTENITLTTNNLAAHTHTISGTGTATVTSKLKVSNAQATIPTPTNTTVLATGKTSGGDDVTGYAPGPANTELDPSSIVSSGTINMTGLSASVTGQSVPVTTTSPFLALNFCIAIEGIFPPRS